MHNDIGVPPDGAGEVRVVGQPQPEVPKAIATQVCTKIRQEVAADKTKMLLKRS